MGVLYQAYRFINHWLEQESKHSVHSPALFKFYSEIILKDVVEPWHQPIENSRKILLENTNAVEQYDLGSGTQLPGKNKTVSQTASTSLTPAKWSRLLTRLLKYCEAKDVLELGTCLGINTLYISNDSQVNIKTIEGNPHLASLSGHLFKESGRKNIELITGSIDTHLEQMLASFLEIDLAFLDANHRYEPTVRYASMIWEKIRPGGILIADDNNRSAGMRKAWNELKKFENCQATFDLFRWGIMFKSPSPLHGHHTWKY